MGFVDRAIGQVEVAMLIACHPNHIPRLVKQNRFPRPFKKTPGGRDNAWMLSQIAEYLRQRQIEAGLIGPSDPPLGLLGQDISDVWNAKGERPALPAQPGSLPRQRRERG